MASTLYLRTCFFQKFGVALHFERLGVHPKHVGPTLNEVMGWALPLSCLAPICTQVFHVGGVKKTFGGLIGRKAGRKRGAWPCPWATLQYVLG